jgi:hypothetical protein
LQQQVLRLSRTFYAELWTPRGLFIKGYLEQQGGSKFDALCCYLDSMCMSSTVDNAILANVALLWRTRRAARAYSGQPVACAEHARKDGANHVASNRPGQQL